MKQLLRSDTMNRFMAVMVLCAALAACGGSSSSSQSSGPLAGSWNFTTTGQAYGSNTGTAALLQSGSTVTGTLTMSFGSECIGQASITGAVDGHFVNLQTNSSTCEASAVAGSNSAECVAFTGALSTDGTKITGSFGDAGGGCITGPDSGTWTAARQ
jgi:hypothetical protein